MSRFTDLLAGEWRRIARGLGLLGSLVLAGIAVFLGYVIPRLWGYQFLDPKITLIYLSLGMVMVLPVATQAFDAVKSEHDSPVLVAVSKLAAVTLWSWGTVSVIYGVALLAVNLLKHARGRLLPELSFVAAALLLSFLLTAFVATLAAYATLQFGSAETARRVLRIGLFVVVAALLVGSRYAAPNWPVQLSLAALKGTFATAAFLAAPGLALLDLFVLRAVVSAMTPRV